MAVDGISVLRPIHKDDDVSTATEIAVLSDYLAVIDSQRECVNVFRYFTSFACALLET